MNNYKLYLNGQWQASDSALEVINPSTGQAFASIATTDRAGVAKALEDAQAAWGDWRNLTAQQRGQYLFKIADVIKKRSDEIAKIITLENGKPLAQSYGEVNMTIDHFQWFAEQAKRTYGRIVPQQATDKRHFVLKSPVGVVGAIAPWNFPLVLAVRKVAPAMAAGCPVILKPASSTPISAALLAECVEAAGVPAGVFQFVVGKASEIGAQLLENPICRKISFTGSTEVGKLLIEGSAKTVTNMSMELGGHAPFLVFDDAPFDAAVQGAAMAKFRNSGQACISANRIYVQRGIYKKFVDAFVATAQSLKLGDGFEDGVDVGPLVDQAALDHALTHIDQAVASGAKVVCGGKRAQGLNGYYLEPTVLVDVPDDALCMTEETFAPVAPLCVFDDEADAVARANNTRYGLAAYAFTNDFNRAHRMMEQLEAGTVCINDSVPAVSSCPFGGMKESGLGRELGIEGIEPYLETKHVSIGGVK
jgi:succinate-semialdehyde dehydrogenase/glutarate-semialdehyde dehydrogenase